ncbi:chaperone protein DnaK-like [Frankliniella occidentalis]|uniref:Chaperone protein DnaK-like n=1 Tax=Frankliniella occidentalis TaxID=133901 RepID=A0A9C6WPE6_FRAOC|nr:chaperone protein DnaK-like [Frankliniella occidentalis]
MHYPELPLPPRERTVHPEEVAAAIFRDLRETARLRLGQDVRRAVIGVPSYFNAAQRVAVMQAAELAGLRVERLCDETSAAALAYARVSPKEGVRKVVIVDLGGGGGSAAVVEVQSRSRVRVLASSGTRLLGGEDLDATMLLLLGERKSFNDQVWEKLRLQWREAKKKLSFSHPSADIKIFSTESKEEICFEVTQEDLKKPFCDWCEGIIEGIRKVMMDANIDMGEVKDVVLMGASGRFPKLRMEVENLFNKKCCKIVNADEGVAIGTALLGARLASMTDITPLPIQIRYTTYYFKQNEIESTSAQTELPHSIYKHTMIARYIEIFQSVPSSEGNVCHFKCYVNHDDEIHININGIFEKIDYLRRKKKLCIATSSNLPEEMLLLIKQKVVSASGFGFQLMRQLFQQQQQ